MLDGMPMINVAFFTGEVQGSIIKCDARCLHKTLTTNNMLKSPSFFLKNSRTFKTGLHGFLHNCVRPKRCAKRQVKPMLDRTHQGIFSVSPFFNGIHKIR